MLYEKFVKELRKCPFCNLKKEEILKENESAALVIAKAPYIKDHLLVVPKEHTVMISALTKKQREDIESLVDYGLKKLHKKYRNVTVLYREGDKREVGKTVDHAHYHLIPNMRIGSMDVHKRKRRIYSDKEYSKMIKEARRTLKI